jgi:chaperonin GroEL (HSP60 family)
MSDSRIVDARTGAMVDAWESGILDSAAVLQYAVRCAFSSAAQALTIGALVQHRKPAIATVEG